MVDNEAFWNTTSQFYTTLKGWGFSEENIIVHYGLGVGPENRYSLDSDSYLDDDIDFVAQSVQIDNTFAYLSETLTPEDVLVVFVACHGIRTLAHTFALLPLGQRLSDSNLADISRNINCGSMFYFINTCYSGGFVDNIMNDESALCQNRAIHTISGSRQEAYAEKWMTGRGSSYEYTSSYIEFPLYWSAAARKTYPYLFADTTGTTPYFDTTPYNHYFNVGELPFNSFSYSGWNNEFPNNPHDHNYLDRNPDSEGGNDDGIFQLNEIFSYANDFDTWTQSGYYNPCSSGTGEERVSPIQSYSSDLLHDYLTLRGLAGDITEQTLDITTNIVVGDDWTLTGNCEMTIDDNLSITVLSGASIIVEEGATLNIGSGCTISCEGDEPAIVVKGSIKILEGVSFVGKQSINEIGLLLDNCSETTLKDVVFNKCDLVSENSKLTIKDSHFDKSLITQHGNSLNVDDCSFSDASVYAYNVAEPPSTDNVEIVDSEFLYCTMNAIEISGYPKYAIQTNTIADISEHVEAAIFINESGFGGNFAICDNSITDNNGVGIMLYGCYAKIDGGNIINNNTTGIAVLDNTSWTSGGNLTSPLQVLSGNVDGEVFFYYDSFPESFVHNIIDHQNLISRYVICADVGENEKPVDFSYNCWDVNFDDDADLEPYYIFDVKPYWTPGAKTSPTDSLAKELFSIALISIDNGQLLTAKSQLENIVFAYPNSSYAITSLKRLFQVTSMLDEDFQTLKAYYDNETIQANTSLNYIADHFSNKCDIALGNYNAAIAWYESIIENPISSADSLCAILDLAYLYTIIPDSTRYACHYPEYDLKSIAAYKDLQAETIKTLMTGSNQNSDYTPYKNITMSNYPNPFNPLTTISFNLPKDTPCNLDVFNIKGQKVKTLLKGSQSKGNHKIVWNGTDDNEKSVSSGLYFYKLATPERVITKKMLMLK